MGTPWTPKDVKLAILDLAKTGTYTQEEIASMFGVTRKVIHRVLATNLTTEDRVKLRKVNYSKSKLGANNPMFGKYGDSHPNYVGVCSDGKGYLLVLKPSWFTGRVGSKHVFLHHVVVCEHLGLTEIPEGYCVHHIDQNPYNNSISNLELLSNTEHMTKHAELRKEQRLSERSRSQVASKRVGTEEVHDIV